MQVLLRFDNIGTSFDGTTNASGGAALNALGVAVTGSNRQGVLIQNHSATDSIWYRLKLDKTNAPTVSSVSHHGLIEAGKQVFVAAGQGLTIWLLSSHAINTPTWTAIEVA